MATTIMISLWLLASSRVYGQQPLVSRMPVTAGPRFFIGVDLSRNISNISYRGLHAEVLAKYNNFEKTDRFSYTAAVGYSRMSVGKDTLYQNLIGYYSKGWYAKAGIELGDALPERIKSTFGAQFVLSNYRDGGEFWFADNYFGDARIPFSRENLRTLSLETTFNTYFPVTERLVFNLQLRTSFILASNRKPYPSDVPPYYTPGVGLSGNGLLSGGVSVQAFYRLTK